MSCLFKTVAFWVEGEEEISSVIQLLENSARVTYWYAVKSQDTVRFEMKGFRKSVETTLTEIESVFHSSGSWVDCEKSTV